MLKEWLRMAQTDSGAVEIREHLLDRSVEEQLSVLHEETLPASTSCFPFSGVDNNRDINNCDD